MTRSTLITKARNILVELHLRSKPVKLTGKIIDFDDQFIEVKVMVNIKSGEFASEQTAFNEGTTDWREDRILISLDDISIIA